MNLTFKQKLILGLVVKGNPDGPIDLDELLERVPYNTSKQSMQFSVRALAAKGLIEKGGTENRRGRSRRVFSPTALGSHWASLVCARPVLDNEALEESLTEMDDLDVDFNLD